MVLLPKVAISLYTGLTLLEGRRDPERFTLGNSGGVYSLVLAEAPSPLI